MTTGSSRKHYIDGEVADEIRSLARDKRWSPSQIHNHLMRSSRFAADQVPTLRTVQRYAKEEAPVGESEPWALAGADPGTERAVLDVLAAAIEESKGSITSLTRDLANWVVRVSRAAPDLTPRETLMMARDYQRSVGRGESTVALDAFLALAPWREGNSWAVWETHFGSSGSLGIRRLQLQRVMASNEAPEDRDRNALEAAVKQLLEERRAVRLRAMAEESLRRIRAHAQTLYGAQTVEIDAKLARQDDALVTDYVDRWRAQVVDASEREGEGEGDGEAKS